MTQNVLIFTGLDGSLLDHFSYSFSQPKPLLALLKEVAVPVIPVTSKTRAELAILRCELDSHEEEMAVEMFSRNIITAGELFLSNPVERAGYLLSQS